MDLTWTVDRESDMSLVRCRVHNDDAVRRRVRIESRLDGPVLPPRRAGVPETGWDATGVTLQLASDERRALGFAVPAPPVEPPVELVSVESIDPSKTASETGQSTGDGDPSAANVALRDLADHRPPRAAVTERDAVGCGNDREDGVEPTEHDEWFDPIEERLELVERLTDADLETATEVVEEAGGINDLTALDERVAADAKRLQELSERASSLAARAEAIDAPIEALERLA